MSVREATLQQAFDRAGKPARASGASALRGRVGATTAILAIQFWGLTATLAAWQSGNAGALRGSLAFQAACTVAALTAGRSSRR